MDLLGRVDEANEVETWAQDEVNMLEEIEKQIYQCADTGSNGWAANGGRRAAIKLKGCIEELETEAKRISASGGGCCSAGLWLFRSHDPQKKFRVSERSRRGRKGGIQAGSRGPRTKRYEKGAMSGGATKNDTRNYSAI